MESAVLKHLIDGYEKGTLTREESDKLEEWFQSLNFDHGDSVPASAKDGLEEELYEKFKQRLKTQTNTHTRKLYTRILAAASILIVVSAGLIFNQYRLSSNAADRFLSKQNGVNPQINAVKHHAVLKFANGQEMVLGAERKGLISYVDSTGNRDNRLSSIITPNGIQFHVILADGTGVWLNASSSLTFPVSFNGQNNRSVVLKGEAYFEVAKNKQQPFLVNVVSTSTSGNDALVKVLGTHFNIKAYADEPEIKTTLIEGAVELSNKTNHAYLKPGEQGTVHPGLNQIGLKSVDAQSAMAWKNGNFVFVKEDIRSVMRQIARWYDLEIIYQGDFEGMEFTGTISKYENAAKVLEMLAQTETIKFKLEGRRVTLMP
ncbi:FecR family protein [Pedobacter kyungheensis]|uniref:FecR family protein n=1 Tax=Pedobacter kyungheensis TaxID=1069985 RepID=UPI0006898DBF|nr:FecR family protein [Pedobacter kyungheensis]